MPPEQIEKELIAIKERNSRVEADKAWETSATRKVVLAVLTYIVVLLLLLVVNIPNPYVSALIPSAGFLLSTLSLPWFKDWWIDTRKSK